MHAIKLAAFFYLLKDCFSNCMYCTVLHSPCTLRIQTHIATRSLLSQLHVFETDITLPRFAVYYYTYCHTYIACCAVLFCAVTDLTYLSGSSS